MPELKGPPGPQGSTGADGTTGAPGKTVMIYMFVTSNFSALFSDLFCILSKAISAKTLLPNKLYTHLNL